MSDSAREKPLKAYRAPKLTVYGTVVRLTAGGSAGVAEAQGKDPKDKA